MATVINVAVVKPRLQSLGWNNVNISEALDDIAKAGISPAAVLAYLDALIAAQDALDDSTIPNCPAQVAAVITGYLKKKGLVAA